MNTEYNCRIDIHGGMKYTFDKNVYFMPPWAVFLSESDYVGFFSFKVLSLLHGIDHTKVFTLMMRKQGFIRIVYFKTPGAI